jgi:sugar phosphate isomerase/epimerase
MKISVSSYSFNQYIGKGKIKLQDTVKLVAELGFSGIEFIDLPGDTYDEKRSLARELRQSADSHGLTIIAYSIGANLALSTQSELDAEVSRICRQLEIANVMGCSVMRHDICHSLGKSGMLRSYGLMLPTIADACRRIAEYGATLGIKTCVENHGFVFQDSYRVEELFNRVAHDNFGLLVDIANFACADEHCPDAVSRVAPYAVHVHAKDMHLSSSPREGYSQTRGCNYFKGAIFGEGDVSAEKSLKILKKAGYDGFYSIEFEGSEDCISAIKKSRENLIDLLES